MLASYWPNTLRTGLGGGVLVPEYTTLLSGKVVFPDVCFALPSSIMERIWPPLPGLGRPPLPPISSLLSSRSDLALLGPDPPPRFLESAPKVLSEVSLLGGLSLLLSAFRRDNWLFGVSELFLLFFMSLILSFSLSFPLSFSLLLSISFPLTASAFSAAHSDDILNGDMPTLGLDRADCICTLPSIALYDFAFLLFFCPSSFISRKICRKWP